MKRKIIVISIIVVLVAGISIQLANNKKKIDAKKAEITHSSAVIPVDIITTKLQDFTSSMKKSGTLIPFQEADISSVSSGKITQLNFNLGDYVHKGQVLAVVDISSLQLQLQAAELQAAQAKKDFERNQKLLAGNATTELNFQNAQLKYQNAENQVEQLKNHITDNKIIAPINGQITAKSIEHGEFVAMGKVIGHIVNTGKLKVDVMVSEDQVYTLKENEAAQISTDIYPTHTFNGEISFISNKGDAVHNYQVEVAMQNDKKFPLKAGSFAYVSFASKTKNNVLLIPKSALIKSLENPMVYIVENGKAKVVSIKVGDSYGDKIEVIDGLKEGQEVITSGLVNISDGTAVKAVK